MATFSWPGSSGGGGGGVTTLNGLSGDLTLVGAGGITVSLSGPDIILTGSGGTVTSVALAAPASILSVSGSPVTSSGTLTLNLATQTANFVWAGPTTGSPATPTFRALVAADIPSLSYVSTVGAIDGQSPSANGLVISAPSIYAQSASASFPGMVNLTTQTFAGVKTFSSPPNFSSLTPSQALVLDGSNNVTTLAYTASNTANTLVSRDVDGASAFVNVVVTVTTTVSSGQTILLNAGSSGNQKITGSAPITFNLPNATTLYSGQAYIFNNNSTGVVSVFLFDGVTLLTTVIPGAYVYVTNTDNSTTNGIWDHHWAMPPNAVYGTAGLSITGTLSVSSTTTLATSLTGPLHASAGVVSASPIDLTTDVTGTLPIANGGTNATSASQAFINLSPLTTAGDIIYENNTPAPARLPIGSTGQVLTVAAGLPAWQTSPSPIAPTQQVFTTASGTYTTPTSPAPLYLRVRMVGGGGGGSGATTESGTPTDGAASTFGTILSANGGAHGVAATTGGAGGTASITAPAYGTTMPGGYGGGSSNSGIIGVFVAGGGGGGTAFGSGPGGANYNTNAQHGGTNTGSGGAGGGSGNGTAASGCGGGGGGFVDAIVPAPASTYAYVVGAGGSRSNSTNGNGGDGADGYIEVTEYYQ